ncbi:MAG: wax ester/triacylglycerol synthase family O-acyltransferase [Candidatus Magnetomorum sp.]|nr:wax ester/triacylglycerol synthase family O-acyltransferase [Candidatus Magnetomorum sp.]
MSELMTNVDTFWLHMDQPTNLMIITSVQEFDELLDFNTVKETLEKRLLTFDRFTKRVVKPISGVGIPSWEEDPTFDIRSHLHRVALPSPGDKSALQEMISDLTSVPMDRTKPLWQMYLIENYNEGCVLFSKIHHSIADGIALIHVLFSLTDTQADLTLQDNFPVASASKKTSGEGPMKKNIKEAVKLARNVGKVLKKECIESITNPFHLMELARLSTGLAFDFAGVLTRLMIMPPDPKTSLKGPLSIRKYVAWSQPLDLNDVKLVGRSVRATVNDVLISTVSGALRRYLQKRNDKVNELDLRVAIPVNIRRPGRECELGNRFSLIFLALPIHVEDPIIRMREVKRRMDNIKSSPDAIVGFQALNALGVSPANLAKRAAHFLANKSTAVLTNVPGPKTPLYFAGKKIKNMMFWVPRIGQVGHGISIISYNNAVTIGVVTDSALVPEPEDILQAFQEEFDHIVTLAKSGKIDGDPLIINDMRNAQPDDEPEEELEHEPIFFPSLADTRLREVIYDFLDETDLTKENGPEPEGIDMEDDREAETEETFIPPAQCRAMTQSGSRCKNLALTDSIYCRVHDNMAKKKDIPTVNLLEDETDIGF